MPVSWQLQAHKSYMQVPSSKQGNDAHMCKNTYALIQCVRNRLPTGYKPFVFVYIHPCFHGSRARQEGTCVSVSLAILVQTVRLTSMSVQKIHAGMEAHAM